MICLTAVTRSYISYDFSEHLMCCSGRSPQSRRTPGAEEKRVGREGLDSEIPYSRRGARVSRPAPSQRGEEWGRDQRGSSPLRCRGDRARPVAIKAGQALADPRVLSEGGAQGLHPFDRA